MNLLLIVSCLMALLATARPSNDLHRNLSKNHSSGQTKREVNDVYASLVPNEDQLEIEKKIDELFSTVRQINSGHSRILPTN